MAFPLAPLKVKIPLLHGDLWEQLHSYYYTGIYHSAPPGTFCQAALISPFFPTLTSSVVMMHMWGRLPHQSLQCSEKSSVLAIMPAGSILSKSQWGARFFTSSFNSHGETWEFIMVIIPQFLDKESEAWGWSLVQGHMVSK